MTFQLSRLRLASIGETSARFHDTTVPLTAGGEPVDSVVWLRNGGGKSSLLSLFFAHLVPRRTEFMGAVHKRHLEDYVGAGDTAHVVAEWVGTTDDPGLFDDEVRLVTGAVHEWPERRRPADAEREHDKLRTVFYAFHVVPGVVDLDRLPIRDGRTLRNLAEFVGALRALAADHPRMNLVRTEHQREWAATLTARHLDPALFAYQKNMNRSEGGIAALFDFPDHAAFIDFLVELTVEPGQPDRVAANLNKVAGVLSNKPRRLLERDFCDAVVGRLVPLAAAAAEARTVRAELVRAAEAVRRQRVAFNLAAAVSREEANVAERERKRYEDRRVEASRRAEGHRAQADELRRVDAELRVAEAAGQMEAAEAAARAAETRRDAWRVTTTLAEFAEVDGDITRYGEQVQADRERLAPLRSEHDEAGRALRAALRGLVRHARAVESSERATGKRARDERARLDSERERLRRERTGLGEQHAALSERMRLLDADLEQARRRGDLDLGVEPRTALAGVAERIRNIDARRGALTEAAKIRRVRREEVKGLLGRERRAAEESRQKASRLTDQHADLSGRVENLLTEARLVELAESDELDLHGDAPQLQEALVSSIAAAEERVVGARVDGAEDERVLAAVGQTGLLPPTREVLQVVDLLASRGITAVPGWRLVVDTVPRGSRAAALVLVPELAAGIVLDDDEAVAGASAVLAATGMAVSTLVTLTTAREIVTALVPPRTGPDRPSLKHPGSGSPGSDHAGPAVPRRATVALNPGLVDPGAAAAEAESRREAGEIRDRRTQADRDQAAADSVLLDRLRRLLVDCPAGHLTRLAEQVVVAQGATDRHEAAVAAAEQTLQGFDDEEETDRAEQDRLVATHGDLGRMTERLTVLADRVDAAVAWRVAVADLDMKIVELDASLSALDEEIDGCGEQARQAELRAYDAHRDAEDYATRVAAVTLLTPDLDTELTPDLDTEPGTEPGTPADSRTDIPIPGTDPPDTDLPGSDDDATGVPDDGIETIDVLERRYQAQQTTPVPAETAVQLTGWLGSCAGQATELLCQGVRLAQEAVGLELLETWAGPLW